MNLVCTHRTPHSFREREVLIMRNFVLAAMAILGVESVCAAEAEITPQARCAALGAVSFTRVTDATTQILKTEIAKVTPESPEMCVVDGYVAPNIGIRIALPLIGWNGKLFQGGCGGSCGSTRLFWCDEPITRGYACLSTDMGHTSGGLDWTWADNNLQAMADFGFRATHRATLAGKAIIEAYYNSAPKYSYFQGCSTGGRQAMVAAQHFPWDFDGIVAGAPAINWTGAGMGLWWNVMANRRKGGGQILQEADIRLLHAAVMEKCDALDGLKDGIIGDPRECKFDPASLQCKAGNSTACLGPEQVGAIRKIYSGPHTSDGKPTYTGSAQPGSELNWLAPYIGVNDKPAVYAGFIGNQWQFAGFSPAPGPNWDPTRFDFDKDFKRFGLVEPLLSGSNPDLRKFKARGGKLIGYQGFDDQSIVPLNFIDYYETATRTMGGLNQTQDFFRLFMIPGMNHCLGGVGADSINYLDYLEKWVEKGQAPDVMIGAHTKPEPGAMRSPRFPVHAEKIEFTRPHFPYPAQARYKGSGDPNDAANFVSTTIGDPLKKAK